MAKLKVYTGQYDNIEFPPYEFREYPKYIGQKKLETGHKVDVYAQDAEDEAKLRAEIELVVESKKANELERELLEAKNADLTKKLAELEAKLKSIDAASEPKPSILKK